MSDGIFSALFIGFDPVLVESQDINVFIARIPAQVILFRSEPSRR